MAEYDVNEILKKEGFDHIDLGNGKSCEFTKLFDKDCASGYCNWIHSILLKIIDVRYFFNQADYVLQRGDFFTYDTSVRYLDYFSTDYKREPLGSLHDKRCGVTLLI